MRRRNALSGSARLRRSPPVAVFHASAASTRSLESLLAQLPPQSDRAVVVILQHREALDRTAFAATLQAAGGTAQVFAPEAVAFEPGRTWRSPRTGIVYPVAWRLRVGTRAFELVPLLDDQELDSRSSTGAVYWEGAVRLLEAGRERGRGYLEMTGYGDRIRVG